jgi:hypothetical protein
LVCFKKPTFIKIKDFVDVFRELSLSIVGLVHGDDQHRKADFKKHEHRQKFSGVNDETADDDCPRAKEMVERQKIQNLWPIL